MSYELIVKKIDKLGKAETITKQLLGELSREILSYVIETKDVRPVNNLLSDNKGKGYILTPVNWRFACKYFMHYLPFTSNYDEVKECINNGGTRSPLMFKKLSPRSFETKAAIIAEWLDNPENDIWEWSSSIKIEDKPVDWFGKITKTVANASEKGGLNAIDIMEAVMNAGIDSDVLMKAIAEAMAKPVDVKEAA